MAKIHSKKRGKSGSKKAGKKIVPDWVEHSKEEVLSLIENMRKEGKKPSEIGAILRDVYGVPSVKNLTGRGVSRIIRETGGMEYPEDLFTMIKRAVRMREHLKTHKRDIMNRVKLSHVESKIWRLVKYYKKNKMLPEDWKYDPEEVAVLVK